MSSLHLYELCFFGCFVAMVVVMLVPKLNSLLREHDTKQKKEYDKLQSIRTAHLDEYKKEEVNARFAEQKWRKFTTHESKSLKIRTEASEKEQNQRKLAEVMKYHERQLGGLVTAKRKEILRASLGRIQEEFMITTKDSPITFDRQILEISKHFTKNKSVSEK